MEKCQSFKRSGRTLPGWLSFVEWYTAYVVLIALTIPNSQGCLRALGRVARRPIQSGVEVVEDLAQVPGRTKSIPEFHHRDPKVSPLDREPSDAVHLVQLDAQRRSSSLGEIPAPAGARSGNSIQSSVTHSATSRLRELGMNGGRFFLRILGSFRSYSHRTLRTIRPCDHRWNNFKVKHPAATRYANYISWLNGITISVGSAVSLPVELYHTFRTLNHTDAKIMTRIENVTDRLDPLHEESLKEFAAYPDQTIFDLYHELLRQDSRGTYHLGIEDIPRSEDHPDKMDPLFQEITGLPENVKHARRRTIGTKSARMININRTRQARSQEFFRGVRFL